MAMRPILKKLREEINCNLKQNNWLERDEKYFNLIAGAAYDENKQKELKKYWQEHCIKLKPFDIPAGTRWISKSSSGNCCGTIVVPCKAIGLINETSYELLLDKLASLSDYRKKNGIALSWDCDKVQLSTLLTELLEKVYAAIVR